jgi:hypothetical protein
VSGFPTVVSSAWEPSVQLDNPARLRNRAVPGSNVTQRIANAMASNRVDLGLIDSLRRVLQSPNPQAQQLRELIKEIVNG